jgi:hypothetical protein
MFAASVQQLSTKLNQIMLWSADLVAKVPFCSDRDHRRVLVDEAMALFK